MFAPRLLTLVPALAALTVLGGAKTPPPQQESAITRTLVGRLFDASSGRPVAGVHIRLSRSKVGTLTDIQGRFMLLDLPSVAEGMELVLRRRCFLPVRIDAGELDPRQPLVMGLPFRRPLGPGGVVLFPDPCAGYGPS